MTASFWLGACGGGSTAPRGGHELAMTDEIRGKTATAVVDATKGFMAECIGEIKRPVQKVQKDKWKLSENEYCLQI